MISCFGAWNESAARSSGWFEGKSRRVARLSNCFSTSSLLKSFAIMGHTRNRFYNPILNQPQLLRRPIPDRGSRHQVGGPTRLLPSVFIDRPEYACLASDIMELLIGGFAGTKSWLPLELDTRRIGVTLDLSL